MRRVILALALFLGSTLAAGAQLSLPQETLDYPPPANMIVANPGGISVDVIGLSYYRALSGNHALGFTVSYIFRPVGDKAAEGLGFAINYRYHPAGKALWRFHYGPIIGYQTVHLSNDASVEAAGPLVGFAGGWQWFPERGFAVGFAIGEQYAYATSGDPNDVINSVFGFRPLLFLELGYAW